MSGNKWQEISEEERRRIKEDFPVSFINDLIRYDNGLVMPRNFVVKKIEEKLYNFGLRADDIWIVSHPKCGTTWTQELVWMLLNDVSMEKGNVPIAKRSPWIEVDCIAEKEFLKSIGMPEDRIEFLNNMEGRRIIKSHLLFEFLPPKLLDTCKVIYVARNPKDAAASLYHHYVNLPGHGFVGNFDGFMKNFEAGLYMYGGYWNHILSGWRNRDHENMKFLWFEDMKRDTKAVIDDLCEFFHHPLTEDLKSVLSEHVHTLSYN